MRGGYTADSEGRRESVEDGARESLTVARKVRLQSGGSDLEQPARTVDSPYLTSHEAVVYLRLGSLSSLYFLI